MTLAIIGGSGLYQMKGLNDAEDIEVHTPYGEPSGPIVRGRLNDAPVLFIARHGPGHRLSPSQINYRANIFALKELGAKWCVSISAAGSLRPEIHPGDFLVPHQIIDKTFGRAGTFFDTEIVAHVAMGDPYCPILRTALIRSASKKAAEHSLTVHPSGTYVCMEGPAFSTRAESMLHQSWGGALIGMTAMPEAKLAREAEIAYATLAIVTDYDCWKDEEVDIPSILSILERSTQLSQLVVTDLLESLSGLEPSDLAARALDNAILTTPANVGENVKSDLAPLLSRVWG